MSPSRGQRIGRRYGAWAIAIVAVLVAMLLQQFARNVWQVRTLPERSMETLLLLVPLDLFERGLQQFGANAKDIALVGTYLGMIVLLLLVGRWAVRAGDARLSIGAGITLWLLAMLVALPLTGAGVFATGLLLNPIATDAAYLGVFGAYTAVLALGCGLHRVPALRHPSTDADVEQFAVERRSLLAGLGGALVTLIAFGVARSTTGVGGAVQSSLPLAAAPTPRPAPSPTPVPVAPTAVVAAGPTPTAGATVAPTSAPTATPDAFATPAPVRAVARDQEGSLTAAGRAPGMLAPQITSNPDFYIVTKNAIADPVVDAASWRLVIDGAVDHPVQIDYATLLALPPVEITKTLECISNLTAGCNMASFGCDLMSTAVWRGAAVSDVLALAGGLKSDVVDVAFLASDEFSAGLPADAVMDPATLLVYQMNGQVLPREHGYPVRLLVPGRYGMKNPKWLAGIRALNQPFVDWYQQRGWTRDGTVKTMSRIDMPADGSRAAAGSLMLAGVAYAGDRGIKMVEVSADGGSSWQPAMFIEPAPSKDAMVRWQTSVQMRDAPLNVVVRATDGTGVVQADDFGLPAPDGGWGQDAITIVPA